MAIMTGNLFDQIDNLVGRDAIRYRHPGQLREPARHGFHGILTGTATANLVTGLVTISGGHALLDAVNIQAPAHVVR